MGLEGVDRSHSDKNCTQACDFSIKHTIIIELNYIIIEIKLIRIVWRMHIKILHMISMLAAELKFHSNILFIYGITKL